MATKSGYRIANMEFFVNIKILPVLKYLAYIRKHIFEMAAMPFHCNGHLLCCVNIPTVL